MATISTDPNEYDPNKEPQPTTPTVSGGEGSVVTPTGGPSPTTQPSFAPAPTSSGRFTNIQKYLQASQGPRESTAGRLAGKVAGEKESVVSGIREQAAETAKRQQEARQQYAGGLQNFQPFIQQTVGQAQQLGAGAKMTPEQVEQFRKLATAQFGGPQELVGGQALQARAETAKQTAGLTATAPGQQALLQQYFGRPTYTTGQRSLDTLLLQAPEARRQLAAARASLTPVTEQVKQAQETAAATGRGLVGEAQTVQKQAQQAVGEALTGQEQALTQKTQEAQTAQEALLQRLGQGLSQRQLSTTDIQQLGLTPNMALLGADPSQYFRATGLTPTEATVASPEEYARYQAISQLAGQQGGILPGEYRAEQAYTPQQAYQFDLAGLQQDIAGRTASFEDIGLPAQAQAIIDRSRSYEAGVGRFGTGYIGSQHAAMLLGDITRERPKVANLARQYGFTGTDDEIIAKLVNQGRLGGGTIAQT